MLSLGQIENQQKWISTPSNTCHLMEISSGSWPRLNLGGMLLSEPRHKIVDLKWMVFWGRFVGRASGEWRLYNKNISWIRSQVAWKPCMWLLTHTPQTSSRLLLHRCGYFPRMVKALLSLGKLNKHVANQQYHTIKKNIWYCIDIRCVSYLCVYAHAQVKNWENTYPVH